MSMGGGFVVVVDVGSKILAHLSTLTMSAFGGQPSKGGCAAYGGKKGLSKFFGGQNF